MVGQNHLNMVWNFTCIITTTTTILNWQLFYTNLQLIYKAYRIILTSCLYAILFWMRMVVMVVTMKVNLTIWTNSQLTLRWFCPTTCAASSLPIYVLCSWSSLSFKCFLSHWGYFSKFYSGLKNCSRTTSPPIRASSPRLPGNLDRYPSSQICHIAFLRALF